jgi:hypothetical protein
MSLRVKLLAVVVIGALAGTAGWLLDPGGSAAIVGVLGAGIVAGELFELRPLGRAALPLSLAVMVVLARVASIPEFAVVIVAAELTAAVLRPARASVGDRVTLTIERLTEAAATVAAYRLALSALDSADARVEVLVALVAGSVAGIAVADLWHMARELRRTPTVAAPRNLFPLAGRTADLTLIASGMLMAVGARGIDGKGDVGLWGVLLFAVPLMAACFAFERVAAIRSVYDQTIRALSAVPEIGGFVRPGHAERVADLAVSVGEELDFGRGELEQLRTAALLHHLGQVCLDEPLGDDGPDVDRIAAAGASILRATGSLAPAGHLVAAEPLPYRTSVLLPRSIASGGQILKVASAFDDASGGDPSRASRALAELYRSPGYTYDGRVLAALETVLARRGLLRARV